MFNYLVSILMNTYPLECFVTREYRERSLERRLSEHEAILNEMYDDYDNALYVMHEAEKNCAYAEQALDTLVSDYNTLRAEYTHLWNTHNEVVNDLREEYFLAQSKLYALRKCYLALARETQQR